VKYLKLEVKTESRGVLYEKDVEARNALEAFVRSIVSGLVHDGTIREGEHYCATAVPRYGDFLRQSPVVVIDEEKAAEVSDWVEMRFEEDPQPDKPIRYFTIEFRVKESGVIYRYDYQMRDVAAFYVRYGISQALLNLGVLQQGEYFFTTFFARDDDDARFDRESIPALESQASSLVELVSPEPIRTAFPFRDPSVYGEVQMDGQTDEEDIRIFVRRDTMERLTGEAKKASEVERGGLLVGQVYDTTDAGRHVVEISDFIVSEHTASTVTELTYTFDSWQSSTAKLREEFPGKKIVGWFHTHLIDLDVYTDETRTEIERTKLFFSRDDVFLHKQFFPDEWYVAMVLDPEGKGLFFQWRDREIVPCGGYAVFEGVGVAGRAGGEE